MQVSMHDDHYGLSEFVIKQEIQEHTELYEENTLDCLPNNHSPFLKKLKFYSGSYFLLI